MPTAMTFYVATGESHGYRGCGNGAENALLDYYRRGLYILLCSVCWCFSPLGHQEKHVRLLAQTKGLVEQA